MQALVYSSDLQWINRTTFITLILFNLQTIKPSMKIVNPIYFFGQLVTQLNSVLFYQRLNIYSQKERWSMQYYKKNVNENNTGVLWEWKMCFLLWLGVTSTHCRWFLCKITLFSSYIHVKVINILQCIDNLCYHTVPKTLFFQDKRSDLIYARYNSIHAQYDSVDTR